MPDPFLIAARAVDFGALAQFAGLFVFLRLVIEPALFASRNTDGSALRVRFLALAWASLVLTLLSSIIWLWLEAQAFSGEPLSAVWRDGVVVTVLKETHFGRNWDVRAVLTTLAVILLSLPGRDGARRQVALLALASGMLASVAWAGHGGATRAAVATSISSPTCSIARRRLLGGRVAAACSHFRRSGACQRLDLDGLGRVDHKALSDAWAVGRWNGPRQGVVNSWFLVSELANSSAQATDGCFWRRSPSF